MTRRPTNIVASVRAKLLAGAHQRSEDFSLTLQRYGAERFLYRLGESRHRERFVLKGAMVFALWGSSMYRATRDLDLAGYGENDAESLVSTIREICAAPCAEDGIEFLVETVRADPIRHESKQVGHRVRLQARLGSARIVLQIDIGFGNAIVPGAIDADYPVLVETPRPHIRAYPRETVVAEKLHAMIVLGSANSRMKDFYDLFVLSTHLPFSGDTLAQAIAATFKRQGTSIPTGPESALTPAFFSDDTRASLWRRYLDRNGLPGAPRDFDAVGEALRAFLSPVFVALAEGQEYQTTWNPGGPWRLEGKGTEEASRFRPYPEYRDSGVEWLPSIPAGWQFRALKRDFHVQLGKMLQNEPVSPNDTLEPYLRAANLTWAGVDSSDVKSMWISPRERELYKLAPDDLLVSEGGDVGRSSIWRGEIEPCYIQNAINRVRSKGIEHTCFLFYWIFALKHVGYIDMLCSRSTISHFTAEKVEVLPVLYPSPPEQLAISAFLDRETSRIDALIEKKERLIELLQEERIALITHAVTKGLDPDAPMKDSGVEWLGEIPAHWRIKKLRYVMRGGLQNGLFKKNEHFGQGVKLVNVIDLYQDDFFIRFETLGRVEADEKELRSYAVKPGDVFFVRSSLKLEGVARSACIKDIPEPTVFECHIVRGKPNRSQVTPEYLINFLNSKQVRQRLIAASITTTMTTISQFQLSSLEVLLPPPTEQSAIVAFLDQETHRIGTLIEKIKQAIDRLKEYRTALISAAVTGKIDVRNA